jgi:hypothetical protein
MSGSGQIASYWTPASHFSSTPISDIVRSVGQVRFVQIAELAVVKLTMASHGHVSRLDEAKAALPLVFMKCIATHVDLGVNRLSTPANL